MLNGLDLFSGIGGITIALQDWVRPIAYCERELYAISILLERMREQKIPCAPICTDVRKLRGCDFRDVDIVYGGFPCQDISVAGLGKGLAGERSGLYWEVHRLVKEIQPSFVFLENVPAIRTRGLRNVVGSLTEIGYDCRWTSVSAAAIGAPHKRERWFLLGHSLDKSKLRKVRDMAKTNGIKGRQEVVNQNEAGQFGNASTASRILSDTNSVNLWKQSGRSSRESWQEETQPRGDGKPEYLANTNCGRSWWSTEPNVGRVVNGLPFRVDRIKCLGNAVVPLQAKTAFERLMGITN